MLKIKKSLIKIPGTHSDFDVIRRKKLTLQPIIANKIGYHKNVFKLSR